MGNKRGKRQNSSLLFKYKIYRRRRLKAMASRELLEGRLEGREVNQRRHNPDPPRK